MGCTAQQARSPCVHCDARLLLVLLVWISPSCWPIQAMEAVEVQAEGGAARRAEEGERRGVGVFWEGPQG
eukprot:COSAG02_NODE_20395_length_833_cov_3.517711_2_plen_69_part_01